MPNSKEQDNSREHLKHLISTVVQETVIDEQPALDEQNVLAGGAIAGTSTGGTAPKKKLLWSGDEPVKEVNTTAIIYGYSFLEGEGPVLEDEMLDDYDSDGGPEGKSVRTPRTNKMKLGKATNKPKNPNHIMLHGSEEMLPFIVPVRYSLLEHFGEKPLKTQCKLVLDTKLDDASKEVIRAFIGFCQGKLGIKAFPTIYLHSKSIPGMTTGAYWMEDNTIHVLKAKRMLVDVLRTIAHELTHKKQHEAGDLEEQMAKQDPMDEMGDLNTGYENEAYEKSGNFVKEFVRRYSKKMPKEQMYSLYENVLDKMGNKKVVGSLRKNFIGGGVYLDKRDPDKARSEKVIKTVAKNLQRKPYSHHPPMMGISNEKHNVKAVQEQDQRHMTNKKLVKIKTTPLSEQSIDAKPVGFWYSVGDEWERWVAAEMPDWKGKYNYQIDIDKSKVLCLTTPEELLAFTEKFGAPLVGLDDDLSAKKKQSKKQPTRMEKLRHLYIDWRKVAQEYSGIEIAPYQYSLRFKLSWYYPWDIASGCIWNSKAVKGIKLVSSSKQKKKSSSV